MNALLLTDWSTVPGCLHTQADTSMFSRILAHPGRFLEAIRTERASFTHQFGCAHSEAVLVGGPGRGVKHDHFAFAEGAP